MSTTPARSEEKVSEEEKKIVLERRKLPEVERKEGSSMDEVFGRIVKKPTP